MPDTTPCRRFRVLYMEDTLSNVDVVDAMGALRHDVAFDACPDGAAGIEFARRHQPSLIDLHLSDLEGDEVLRRWRADPETSGIPVVILSAEAPDSRNASV